MSIAEKFYNRMQDIYRQCQRELDEGKDIWAILALSFLAAQEYLDIAVKTELTKGGGYIYWFQDGSAAYAKDGQGVHILGME